MMLLVAINTASLEKAIALVDRGKVLGEESWSARAQESQKVLPGLDRLLKESKKSWEDVEGVVVVMGPGSYTSLRVGITITNAIAWVRKIPVWGMKTTEIGLVQPSKMSKTFGETVASLKLENLKRNHQISPIYAAPPKISSRKV